MPKPIRPPSRPTLPGHPIAVVAERTGLSRDVLRVWERRYGAVDPIRSAGGQRRYSDEDVTRFRLLAEATSRGRTIGLVAGLTTPQLEQLVAEDEAARPPAEKGTIAATHAEYAAIVEAALELTRALDGSGLDRELRRVIAHQGVPQFIEEIVPSLMHRIGDEWAAGRLTIAHEHVASAAVLAVLLDTARSVRETPAAPRLLVATPTGEWHAVGAALVAAAAALDGWTLLYLGVDVPAADIVAAARTTGVGAVALSVVRASNPVALESELRAVRAGLPSDVLLIVGGAAALRMSSVLSQPGVVVCDSIRAMRSVLAEQAQR
jgi:MerR family transcriptional regulator, light-induced transcriptional regulator